MDLCGRHWQRPGYRLTAGACWPGRPDDWAAQLFELIDQVLALRRRKASPASC